MRKKVWLLLWHIAFLSNCVFAQTYKSIALRPSFGIHQAFFKQDIQASDPDPAFSAKHASIFGTYRFGIFIDYRVREHWMLSTGIASVGVGYGYTIRPNVAIVMADYRSHSVATSIHFPLSVSYLGKFFSLGHSKKTGNSVIKSKPILTGGGDKLGCQKQA